MTQSFLSIKSNIYTVVPRGAISVLPTTVFPHSSSADQMVRLCRNNGYVANESAGKGSHIKLQKAGAAPIILPKRKDLSVGVIKNALASLGDYRLRDLPELIKGL